MTETLNTETGELTEIDEDQIASEMSPDTGDGEPDDDAPIEREREPAPQGPSDADMERGFKTVDQAAAAYMKKIGGAFPDGAINLELCPLCTGRVPGLVDLDFAGRIPEAVKNATMAYLGFAAEQEYEPDPETQTCPVCAGKGEVATGSKVPGNDKRKCLRCQGYGYYPPPSGSQQIAMATGLAHAPVGEHPAPLTEPEVDTTGEPKILPDGRPNPNYGKWPQYKVEVSPYGRTAGLTAQDVAT
jgi:hypothetical protein